MRPVGWIEVQQLAQHPQSGIFDIGRHCLVWQVDLDILIFFYGELVGEGGDGRSATGDEAVVSG